MARRDQMAKKTVTFTKQKSAIDFLTARTSGETLDMSDLVDLPCVEDATEIREYALADLLEKSAEDFSSREEVKEYVIELEDFDDRLTQLEDEIDTRICDMEGQLNQLKAKQKYIAKVQAAVTARTEEASELIDNLKPKCSCCKQYLPE